MIIYLTEEETSEAIFAYLNKFRNRQLTDGIVELSDDPNYMLVVNDVYEPEPE